MCLIFGGVFFCTFPGMPFKQGGGFAGNTVIFCFLAFFLLLLLIFFANDKRVEKRPSCKPILITVAKLHNEIRRLM